jgi:two-component system, sensor histidine kinase and response regulator
MGKATILVIDDEQRFLDIITKTLKTSDYKVLQALNGEMGVMVARKFIPDIIICDWEMPVLNGIDAIKILKQDDLTTDIPIIMATGAMTSTENLNTALKAGAIDYIRKPIDLIELIARINSALILSISYKDIKEKNAEIVKQNAKLKLLNTTKDKFFKIISHDLKSPFQSIIGFSNLLNTKYDSLDDFKRKAFIQEMNTATLYAYDLLENLLTWARTQTDEIQINKEKLNLKELVETSIYTLLSNANAKNIRIINIVQPELIISIDENTALTIIRNIVSNAIKFTHKGGHITIGSASNEGNIKLHISDTGVGMTPEVIDKLFHIGENVSTKGTDNEMGTGLGLILCKEFVEKQGGAITVKSEVNKGSKFIISLPQ